MADAAFRRAPDAGVWAAETEPDGRTFRWTAATAAWRIPGGAEGAAVAVLPVRNARPDRRVLGLDVWVDDAPRGRATLPAGPWRLLEVPVTAAPGVPVVLRVAVSETFRPPARSDRRELGIETGPAPALRQAP
jgi:hypothetical protein